MIFKKFRKYFTGIDINADSINMAKIEKIGDEFKLLHCKSRPISAEIFKPSFNTNNIINLKEFLSTVEDVMSADIGRNLPVGLSVPDETIKILIKNLDILPKSRKETERMLAWNIEKTYYFSLKEIKMSYDSIGKGEQRGWKFLIALGVKEIISELEKELKRLKINVKVIRPAGINHLNFYRNNLISNSTFAYIGIFKTFLTFFIFKSFQIIFYQGIKLKNKSTNPNDFLSDVSPHVDLMLSRFYKNNSDNNNVEKIYIDSCIENLKIGKLNGIDAEILNANDVKKFDNNHVKFNENESLLHYISAISAAQSLII